MQYPKFIKISNTSFMELDEVSGEYTTRGWSLPLKYVTKELIIRGFMKHLNGCKLVPISKEEYLEQQGETYEHIPITRS